MRLCDVHRYQVRAGDRQNGPRCAAASYYRDLCSSCCVCSLGAQALDCRYLGNPPVLTLMADMTLECASISLTAIPPEFLCASVPVLFSGGSSSEMWMLHIVGAIVFIGMRHERIIIIMQSPSSGLLSIPLRTPRAVSGSCGLQSQGLWMQGLLLASPLCLP